MKIVLFIGYSGSGKTTALASLTRAIVGSKKGKVGTVKRIHEADFSIDKKGKDTWLHASAGASIVVAFAPREVSIIRKDRDSSSIQLSEILGIFRSSDVDYLLVEGLHKKFERVNRAKRVICAKNEAEALDLMKTHKEKIAFVTGKVSKPARKKDINGVPVLALPRNNSEALRLIDR